MIDVVNRVVLVMIGLALAGAGTIALLARAERLPFEVRQPGNAYARATESVTGEPFLWWPLIIGIAVVVASLMAIWLRAQFVRRGGRGIGTQRIDRTSLGTTEVDAAPVAAAVARDLESLPGVDKSSVRLLSLRPTAQLIARLDLVENVDPHVVGEQAETVLERLRNVAGARQVDAELRMRLAATSRHRVR